MAESVTAERHLAFRWSGTAAEALAFTDGLLYRINARPWRGFPAWTCLVAGLLAVRRPSGAVSGEAAVLHRPCGFRAGDGPLYPVADFNDFDFGEPMEAEGGPA